MPERTDVLSDLLQTMHLTNVMQGVFELRSPWALELDTSLVVIAAGSGVALDGRRALEVSAGDVLLRTRGAPLVLRDSVKSRAPVYRSAEAPPSLGLGRVRVGGSGPPTTLVAVGFRFASAALRTPLDRLAPLLLFSSSAQGGPAGLSAAVSLFIAEATGAGDGSSAILGRLADVLLIQALRSSARREGCPSGDLRALADPQLSQALRLMHGQYERGWTVASLARKVGLSRSSFAARFTARAGEPPLEYLSRWRMTRAAGLLLETSQPLSEIAGAVGYTSEAAFSKAFSRVMKQPPGAFRRSGGPPRTTGSGADQPQ